METTTWQVKVIVGILGFGLVAACAFAYIEYRSLTTLRADFLATRTANEDQIKQEYDALVEAKANNDSFVAAFANERAKNEAFGTQVKNISDTVGTLTKLSETDPQLLAKYSKIYFLNENYTPVSLATIEASSTVNPYKTYQFHSQAIPFLENMLGAARQDGAPLLVASAYRSFASQSALKSAYTVRYGTTKSNSFSADQGYSEHQLGTAVDFSSPNLHGAIVGFDKDPGFVWLNTHAYEYGFILSYPSGNKYYVYEPWHWRFVGVKLAKKIHEDGTHFYDLDQRTINAYLITLFDR
jgi:LAS superfamily LD-carboxypeptidase LdcB